MTTVSNSELNALGDCERKHYYGYDRGIQSIENKTYFRLGGLGHLGLEHFYLALQENKTPEVAKHLALGVVMDSDEDLDMKMQVMALLSRYVNHYGENDAKNYVVISVEKVATTPLVTDLDFGFITDLVLERVTGPERGRLIVVDHKWVANFKSSDDIALDIQLPRYAMALQMQGVPIKGAMFNQIRTRDMKAPEVSDLFKRSPVPINPVKLGRVWDETKAAALKVQARDYSTEPPIRHMAPMSCKNCDFRDLCVAELNGTDSIAIHRLYKKRERRDLEAERGEEV